jgi:hypothetical protein
LRNVNKARKSILSLTPDCQPQQPKEPKQPKPKPQPNEPEPEEPKEPTPSEQRPCAKCGKLFPAADVAGHEHRRLNGHRLDNGRWCEGRRWFFEPTYPKSGGDINEGDPRCHKRMYLDPYP